MRLSAFLAAAGIAVLTLAALSFNMEPMAAAQTTTTIDVGDLWFCSSSFQNGVCQTTINAGDTVEWRWVGSASHSSTACTGGDYATCGAAQGWDSGNKASGTFSRTFTQPGTFYYRCNVHPTAMRGQITVLAQATPTPTPSATASPAVSPTPTPSLSPTATTPTPAGVPVGGGPPSRDGAGTALAWWLFLAAGGGLLLTAAAALAVRAARRP